MNISIKTFRRIRVLEAISFLTLLAIAMPLKYFWGMPQMVQIVGMAHGVLFVIYILGAFIMHQKLNWNLQTLAIVISCSVIPFGPFFVERKYLL